MATGVLLDSNIIVRDFKLSGSDFAQFFAGISRSGDTLYLPRIVIDEAKKQYEKQIRDEFAQATTAGVRFWRLTDISLLSAGLDGLSKGLPKEIIEEERDSLFEKNIESLIQEDSEKRPSMIQEHVDSFIRRQTDPKEMIERLIREEGLVTKGSTK